MKRIRGGSGLGDAIYVRVVAEHLKRRGEEVVACSDYRDVFDGSGLRVESFSRENIQVLAHYTAGKSNPNTTQWQDVCCSAGVAEIPVRLDWSIKNLALTESLRAKADGRPIIAIHGGRAPMGRTDGFGLEMLPDRLAFDAVLTELSDCYLVRIGKGNQLYQLASDIDLNDSTTISDVLDVFRACDGVVAQCSFAVPLAEAFDKPLLTVWAERGMRSNQAYIKTITPKKILSKPTSTFVMDDWPVEQIVRAAQCFKGLLL